MKPLKLFCILFVLSVPQLLTAQRPVVSVSINKKKILIGEQLSYRITVQMPDNTYRLSWFTVPSDFGSFVVASTNKIDSTYSNGILGFSQLLNLTSFDSGRQLIYPLELDFSSLKSDSSFKMLTDSIPIDVTYSPADSVLPFHDIKPIIPVAEITSYWLWIIIGALTLIIIILAIYFYRRRKNKKPPVPENILPPHEIALQALNDLQNQHLPEKGEYRLYFVSLSEIIKKYLSGITNSDQMSLTDGEVIHVVNSKINRDSLTKYASALRMGEAAKFAKYKPVISDCNRCLEEMKNMITEIEQSIKKPEDAL